MSKVTDKLKKLLERFETMEVEEYEKLYDAALRDIDQFAGYAKSQFYVEKDTVQFLVKGALPEYQEFESKHLKQ